MPEPDGTGQPEAPGLNPRVVFLRQGLEASCQGRPREGRLAEAGRKCLPGLVALEVLRDEGCPFPEEGTMAVWSLKPEPSLGGGRLGGEGQVSARPLHTHTGLKARGAVWSGPWPPLSDHGLRHGMMQEWGGGARPKGPPAASSACCLAPRPAEALAQASAAGVLGSKSEHLHPFCLCDNREAPSGSLGPFAAMTIFLGFPSGVATSRLRSRLSGCPVSLQISPQVPPLPGTCFPGLPSSRVLVATDPCSSGAGSAP